MFLHGSQDAVLYILNIFQSTIVGMYMDVTIEREGRLLGALTISFHLTISITRISVLKSIDKTAVIHIIRVSG